VLVKARFYLFLKIFNIYYLFIFFAREYIKCKTICLEKYNNYIKVIQITIIPTISSVTVSIYSFTQVRRAIFRPSILARAGIDGYHFTYISSYYFSRRNRDKYSIIPNAECLRNKRFLTCAITDLYFFKCDDSTFAYRSKYFVQFVQN